METEKSDKVSSTIYTVYKETACEKHPVTIVGKKGYKINITKAYVQMSVKSKGATATAWVNANGDKIAKFTETSTAYKSKSANVNFTGKSGGSVLLDWYLLTSKSSIRAYMIEWYVVYDYIADAPVVVEPEEPIETNVDCRIEVVCDSKELDALLSKIKTAAEGKEVKIFKEV